MKKHREDVLLIDHLDGVLQGTRVDKNRMVYTKPDGTEYLHNQNGYTPVSREDGRLVVHRYCKTVEALNVRDLLKRVQDTGGTVVILPP